MLNAGRWTASDLRLSTAGESGFEYRWADLHTKNKRFYLAPLRVPWSGIVVEPQKGSFARVLWKEPQRVH